LSTSHFKDKSSGNGFPAGAFYSAEQEPEKILPLQQAQGQDFGLAQGRFDCRVILMRIVSMILKGQLDLATRLPTELD